MRLPPLKTNSLLIISAAKTFWQKDVKTYRDYYKTVKPGTDEFRDMMSQWRETKRKMDGGKDEEEEEGAEFEDASEESQLAYLVAQMKAHPHVQVTVAIIFPTLAGPQAPLAGPQAPLAGPQALMHL